MISYKYKENGRTIKHLYFIDKLSYEEFKLYAEDCDELSVYYANILDSRINNEFGKTLVYMSNGSNWFSKNYSILIDLKQSEKEILENYHKNRRYKVKRAIDRDNLKLEFKLSPKVEDLLQVEDFYNKFAISKGLEKLSIDRYKASMEKGYLALSFAYNSEGDILVVNGYLLDKDNMISTFAFGASHFRFDKEQAALIGRANSCLHYFSMCQLKLKGYIGYDFGGLYVGQDIALNNISDFKRSFGGKVIEYAPKIVFQKKDLIICEKNLNSLNHIINEKQIVIWGYSVWGKYIIERLYDLYGIKPVCVIDQKKSGNVEKPDILKKYVPSETFLIVTTRNNNYLQIKKNIYVEPYVNNKSVLCIREEYL